MTSEVKSSFQLDIGEQDLQDLVTAGDDNAWSLDDWSWDSKNFIAKPLPNYSSSCRANKRHCSGLGNGNPTAPFLHMLQKPCCAPDKADVLKPSQTLSFRVGDAEQVKDKPQRFFNAEGKGVASCQVEDCRKDLSHLSTYHQRCHICEVHIKEQQFMRSGKLQRFCQQCGRCHELSAFQGPKRSCREQLAKHNARRRRQKKQEGPIGETLGPCHAREGLAEALASLSDSWIADSPPANFDAADILLPDSLPDILPPPQEQKPINDEPACLGRSNGSTEHNMLAPYAPMKSSHSFPSAPCTEGLAYPTAPGYPQAGSMPLPCHSIAPAHSQCAEVRGEILEIGQTRHLTAPSQPSSMAFPNLQEPFVTSGTEPYPENARTIDWPRENQERDSSGESQMLPFNTSHVDVLLHNAQQISQAESSFQTALSMMRPPVMQPHRPCYQSDNVILRMSIKLFDCTPASLPPDLKEQLTGWLKSTPMGLEGYLRPGCVHLLVQAMVSEQEAERIEAGGVRLLVEHLRGLQDPFWENHIHLLELNQEFALVKEGRLISVFGTPAVASPSHLLLQEGHAAMKPCGPEECTSCAEDQELLVKPELHAVHPAIVHMQVNGPDVTIELRGKGISNCRSKLLCRSGGLYMEGGPEGPGAGVWIRDSYDADGEEVLEVALSSKMLPGLAIFEVQTGCLLSEPLPVLVCPTPKLAEELQSIPECEGVHGIVLDLGIILGNTDQDGQDAYVALASKLTEFACLGNLPELLSCLLDCCPQLKRQILLRQLHHLCVQRNSLAALEILLRTHNLAANPPGLKGITPLHLAAIGERGAEFAQLICSFTEAREWVSCWTDDGLSPSDFAMKAGHRELDTKMKAQSKLRSPVRSSGGRPIREQLTTCPSGSRLCKQTWETTSIKCGSPATSTSTKDTNSYLDLYRHHLEMGQHSDSASKSWISHDYDSESESVAN